MYYAVLWALVINGNGIIIAEPQRSLEQCREIAALMQKHRDEEHPDAKCVALFFDQLGTK